MTTLQIILIVIFIVAAIIGYFLINNVPSLLHTPLMSGMNALSGITILGAIIATAIATKGGIVSQYLGGIAIIAAVVNVFAGFGVTDRMLGMFHAEAKKDDK
ncbi:MAG: NAD(P) transhydrogenase subunit alpha [Acholeplasmataceae bacterium]|jgi:NAD(P) transhydrogenase subunit alpha|nr:NAD(P) transhydrogenase subunit alpha [Acholeplasmataceae bacterium]